MCCSLRSKTPEKPYIPHQCGMWVLSAMKKNTSTFSSMEVFGASPFNLRWVFGSQPNCLRLKVTVARHPPRLATSRWLILFSTGITPVIYDDLARPHLLLLHFFRSSAFYASSANESTPLRFPALCYLKTD